MRDSEATVCSNEAADAGKETLPGGEFITVNASEWLKRGAQKKEKSFSGCFNHEIRNSLSFSSLHRPCGHACADRGRN